MSSVYEAIVAFVGDVPSGMEPVVYVFALILSLFFVNCTISILSALILGRGRS